MNTKSLSATEVKNRFGRVLREVSRTGGPIIVERDGKPVAVILGVKEYGKLRRRPFGQEAADANLQAVFGMWVDLEDITDEWLADGRSRWESNWDDE